MRAGWALPAFDIASRLQSLGRTAVCRASLAAVLCAASKLLCSSIPEQTQLVSAGGGSNGLRSCRHAVQECIAPAPLAHLTAAASSLVSVSWRLVRLLWAEGLSF